VNNRFRISLFFYSYSLFIFFRPVFNKLQKTALIPRSPFPVPNSSFFILHSSFFPKEAYMAFLPFIPRFITVHLGSPDSDAANVTVTFPEYIKNVASCEIYPTWPDSALEANILAQISSALNRIGTGYYRSRGLS
jgi:hypothetical protein